MLVSHRHRFIFVKSRKTGSTTVEMFFQPFCQDDPAAPVTRRTPAIETAAGIIGARTNGPDRSARWNEHMASRFIRDALGEAMWRTYFKIATVRNPFAQMVSQYLMVERLTYPATEAGARAMRADFRDYALHRHEDSTRRILLMPGPLGSERCEMDALIRLERLAEDVGAVAERLGLAADPAALGHRVRRRRESPDGSVPPLAAFYDARAEAAVRAQCDWLIERFGYTLDERPPEGSVFLDRPIRRKMLSKVRVALQSRSYAALLGR